ncbi:SDR family NAD(P)-dependent oxidoreductase [Dactylosporangium sucinum]|uniref:Short chain dehydrogenase n=1 Tax=Dactylosporangium sucinum TaxID=1424081 RepID=A0A917X4W4_9ACTN|nr:SDR family oxidoreductase [Dactylosporangium sucinum]GGM64720.1 short chain dehydrogenase [Dactylosporangium sucinum]
MSLHGKSLFVTGGNAGIGLATALEFAARGADIAIYARRADKNEEAKQEIEKAGVRCITFTADATDEASIAGAVDETVKTFGGLHYAFNNVGVSQRGTPVVDLSVDEYEYLMDGNVKSTFLAMKHEIPAILATGRGGAICNNASASGIAPVAQQALYGAAKFGVIGLTKAVALEYAKDDLRVNVVCPGATTGDMFLRFREEFPEHAEKAAAAHPMARIGLREEVARAVLFLCTGATFTTGLAFTVDGGRSL